MDRSWSPFLHFRGPAQVFKTFEKRLLAGENLLFRAPQIEPLCPVDLRKTLPPPALRRPLISNVLLEIASVSRFPSTAKAWTRLPRAAGSRLKP
jgi:hypothetical protein